MKYIHVVGKLAVKSINFLLLEMFLEIHRL